MSTFSPKLIDTIKVKFKELYNCDLKKNSNGAFHIQFTKEGIYLDYQVELIECLKEHGYELTHFSLNETRCFYIFQKKTN
ncbi:hypothetical protein M0811_11830 [Anaeramoeba ignava]|uniref:Uncharacterized protein n=1 Tax=Anaeramoeba ignava TaxID=1746090 RepID=A0A9Q0LAB5_ANAIG|nr:hypothetical protein M0811_11830 [Anaeramoeba ignava]